MCRSEANEKLIKIFIRIVYEGLINGRINNILNTQSSVGWAHALRVPFY